MGQRLNTFPVCVKDCHDGKCARHFKVMLHDVGKDSGPATCNDCDQLESKPKTMSENQSFREIRDPLCLLFMLTEIHFQSARLLV